MASVLTEYEVGPFNAGVNLSMLPTDIDDNEAVVIQDMFVNRPGQIYTRGDIRNVVQNAGTYAGTNKTGLGIMATTAPDGNAHLAAISHGSSGSVLNFDVLTDLGGAVSFSTQIDASAPLTSDYLVDAKPALAGGLWIGVQEMPSTPSLTGKQWLFHWRGAVNADYSTGTIAMTNGSKVITGTGTTWTSNVTPGQFLFVTTNSVLVGVVKSVDSNTQITLEANARATTAAGVSYRLGTICGWGMQIAKGRISTQVGSAAVIGSGTKFLSTPFDNNWTLWRSKDNAQICAGTVSTVQGEEGLTLSANALIAMDDEPYVATSLIYNYSVYQISPTANPRYYPGVLNATYASLQWFAREDQPTTIGTGDMHSRVWFSDYRNQFSVDMATVDGDFINVPSTIGQNLPIRAIAPTQNALLIFKENETFAITGDGPDTFALTKIWDDGCICSQSVVTYKGTVIWAGRNGVYQYTPGKDIVNIVTRSLGSKWVDSFAAFDPRHDKVTGAVYNDHYVLSCHTNSTPALFPTLFTIMKNGSTTPTATGNVGSFAIYIPTRGLSFIANLDMFGYCVKNADTFYLAYGGVLGSGYVCNFATLFKGPINGDYPDVGTAYPDPYFESKRYSCKDPLRLKGFKQTIMEFATTNTRFKVEIGNGLGESNLPATWTLLPNTYLSTSGVQQTLRTKFLKRDRFLALKFYNTTSAGNYGLWSLRRFQLGFKWMKVGRV